MKTVRTFMFVAFGCCVVQACPLIAGEESQYSSPNGHFALRITDGKVELIEETSGKVMVDLGEPWRS
jgi:hypothetical protein